MVLRVVKFDGGGAGGGGVADGKNEEEEKREKLGEEEGDDGERELEFDESEEVNAANTGEEESCGDEFSVDEEEEF